MMGDECAVVAVAHSLDLLDALQHSGRAFDRRVQELLGLHGAGHDDGAGCVSERIDTFDGLVESALLNEVSSALAIIGDGHRTCMGRQEASEDIPSIRIHEKVW